MKHHNYYPKIKRPFESGTPYINLETYLVKSCRLGDSKRKEQKQEEHRLPKIPKIVSPAYLCTCCHWKWCRINKWKMLPNRYAVRSLAWSCCPQCFYCRVLYGHPRFTAANHFFSAALSVRTDSAATNALKASISPSSESSEVGEVSATSSGISSVSCGCNVFLPCCQVLLLKGGYGTLCDSKSGWMRRGWLGVNKVPVDDAVITISLP